MGPRARQIRPETPADGPAVRALTRAAFGRDDEAALVDRIRDRAADYAAFVAEAGGDVVGHLALSRVTLDPPAPGLTALGLAPMAVAPEVQRSGVGSALVRHALAWCRRSGVGAVFVLGHPTYYPRFGFEPAARYGIADEYGAPTEAFMVAELTPGALADVVGTARYDPALAG
ncbi:GNAT family N-acetyltransferase [Rubrivirga sp. IMCC45206]|uniref:GNAT family N-acetyltransferase n=1 Tax=Rubrivirga sp. IMCC45206 TaxID=3391614 RepID=UPI00398FDB29